MQFAARLVLPALLAMLLCGVAHAQEAGDDGEEQLTDGPVPIAVEPANPYPGNFRAEREGPQGRAGTSPNMAASPEQQGIARRPGTDLFLPEGFRIGSWQATVSLEQTMGFSSNTAKAPGGKGGAISQTDAAFSAQSDWSRHQASIQAKGSFYTSVGGEKTQMPSGSVDGTLGLDLIDGWKATGTAGYSYETDTDTGTVAGKHNLHGSLGVSREAGIWQFSLRGVTERSLYEDGLFSRKDQNNTYYGAIGRVTYAANPAFSPFVEAEAGIRRHDRTIDSNGERRDSQIQGFRGGIAFDQGEKINGEIAVGWQTEDYEDKNLKDLGGLTVDGEINWSPVRGTNVRLFASTQFDSSSTAGQNGSIVTTAGAEIGKAVNDRFELNAGASAEHTRYDDGSASETVFNASAGFRYWLNRYMALTGTVEQEWLSSDDKLLEYDATTVRAGVRFQR